MERYSIEFLENDYVKITDKDWNFYCVFKRGNHQNDKVYTDTNKIKRTEEQLSPFYSQMAEYLRKNYFNLTHIKA